jgi:hypothetical protein
MRISPLKPAAFAMLATVAVACAAPRVPQDFAAGFPAQAPVRAARADPADAPALARAPHPEAAEVLKRGEGWARVRSAAAVIASDQEPPQSAQARALDKARRKAVEAVAGASIKSGLVVLETETGEGSDLFIQQLTATRVNGLVVEEHLLNKSSDFMEEGTGQRHWVQIEAKVLVPASKAESGLEVKLELDRTRLMAGQEVHVSIEASQDASIYLVARYPGGAAVLLPNRFQPEVRSRKGKLLRFPGADNRIRFQAILPEGVDHSRESLTVFALREGFELPVRSNSKGSVFEVYDTHGESDLYRDFITALNKLAPTAWAFDWVGYEIYAAE